MSEVTNIGIITRELSDQEENTDPNAFSHRAIPEGVEVFEISGPFFFGAAEKFKDTLRLVERAPAVLILRMRNVPAIDATGLNVIAELHARCKRDGTVLMLSDVHAQPVVALQRSHVWNEIGAENIFGNLDSALNHARHLMKLQVPPPVTEFPPTVARERDTGTDKS